MVIKWEVGAAAIVTSLVSLTRGLHDTIRYRAVAFWSQLGLSLLCCHTSYSVGLNHEQDTEQHLGRLRRLHLGV